VEGHLAQAHHLRGAGRLASPAGQRWVVPAKDNRWPHADWCLRWSALRLALDKLSVVGLDGKDGPDHGNQDEGRPGGVAKPMAAPWQFHAVVSLRQLGRVVSAARRYRPC
jgi:hypothetical protein